ncbi:interleukin enhancer-binding factor 3-like [Prunus avium]|uniref:Interleukin enhancer-binding factor 3-like n=1 Tax=Prunus avium TaxID=42229 RepID=A0A6P5TYU7_PRUAV|nr:interleukin enhancer-binding factor 3-like [Prunus avium]
MKLNFQPKPDVQHFSHPHPLKLSNHQAQQQNLNPQALCACCKLNVSGWIYSCKPCNYFLHMSCSEMPQQITHPFDRKDHVLSLLPTPKYPDGAFNCDACMKHGNGFAYHCGDCNIELHTSCASMPLLLSHQSHHHQLGLEFSLPAGSNHTFICDICKRVGRKEWLYLCSPCDFTAHLGCTTATPRAPPPLPPPVQQTGAAAGTQYFPTASPPQFRNYVPNVNYNGMPGGVRPVNNNIGRSGQLGNAMMNQALQSLAGFGRFGGSSNQGLGNTQAQLIQQILSGGGHGGGSGGGNDFGVGFSTDYFGSSTGSIDPSSFGSTDFFSGAGGLGDFTGFSSF